MREKSKHGVCAYLIADVPHYNAKKVNQASIWVPRLWTRASHSGPQAHNLH